MDVFQVKGKGIEEFETLKEALTFIEDNWTETTPIFTIQKRLTSRRLFESEHKQKSVTTKE